MLDKSPRSTITTVEENARSEMRSDQSASGAIPYIENSLYHEAQFTNYTGYDIAVVYHDGTAFIIKPVFDIMANPRVEIRWRRHFGGRIVQNGRDSTQIPQYCRTIPLDLISLGPTYAHTHDLVFCLPEHVNRVVHPNSSQNRTVQLRHLYQEMTTRTSAAPLLSTANDPQGRSDKLYTVIHGEICAVDVRHFSNAGEGDTIVVMVRSILDNGGIENKILGRSTFEDLRNTPSGVIMIGGIPIAATKEQLRRYLDKPGQREVQIPIATHEAALHEHDRRAAEIQDELRGEIKRINEQLTNTRKAAEHYREHKHNDQTAELNLEKIRLEGERLKHDRQKMEDEKRRASEEQAHAIELARIKRHETLITTAGSIIKVAGVAITLYLSFRKK